MYAIISEGKLISLCERPRYITRTEDGIFVEASEEEAIGLAVAGEPYNLPGHTEIEGAPEAWAQESDVGEYVFQNAVTIEQNANDTGSAIVTVQDAVCELDESTDSRMGALEDAICELDEIINGGNDNE